MLKKSAILTLVLLIVAMGLWAFLMFRTPDGPRVSVEIESGVSTGEVAQLLAEKQVISSSLLFRALAKFRGTDSKIRPGSYTFKTGMPSLDALKVLEKGPRPKIFKLTVPEGFTIDEIGERIAADTFLEQEEFEELAKHRKDLFARFPFVQEVRTTSLEGYLFPKTFVFDSETTPSKIIEIMLAQFEKESSTLDLAPAREKGLSLHEIVTIASLIEKEAKVAEERVLISAVIHNRLNIGMPLKIDATIQYALPERQARLTTNDLKLDSPYNTYIHKGLPPGPIANPGLESLRAALNPAPVDYLYYVLTDHARGAHSFTRNYDEFLKFKRQGKKSAGN